MSKLKKLETKKLMKELEFVESDYDYKTEMIGEADSEFLLSVNKFLESKPELKDLFDKKINSKIDQMIKTKEEEIKDLVNADIELHPEINEDDGPSDENVEQVEELQNNEKDTKSPKIKKLYRDIVKLTHPDKINNKKLNDLYIKSTNFYDKNDLAGLYSICDELNIDYEIEDEDSHLISEKITTLKQRINFMESTFTFKWSYAKEQQVRDSIILLYIKMQLNS